MGEATSKDRGLKEAQQVVVLQLELPHPEFQLGRLDKLRELLRSQA